MGSSKMNAYKNKKKYSRRNYLTNKSFQIRYMAMVIILMIIISVAVGITIYSITWLTLMDKLESTDAGPQINKIFMNLNDILFWRVSFIILGGVCLAGLITIFVSHRVAGPFSRANKIGRLISQGIIPGFLVLRKKDEAHDLAKLLNEIISKLNQVREKNTEILERSRSYLKQISKGLSKEEALGDSKKRLEELAKCIDEFEIFAREKTSSCDKEGVDYISKS